MCSITQSPVHLPGGLLILNFKEKSRYIYLLSSTLELVNTLRDCFQLAHCFDLTMVSLIHMECQDCKRALERADCAPRHRHDVQRGLPTCGTLLPATEAELALLERRRTAMRDDLLKDEKSFCVCCRVQEA